MLKLLDAFVEAWNRHDLDALMDMMTDDCVFEASAGDHVNGERHEGQEAVRAAFAAVFERFPDAHWGGARHLVAGDRGLSEWTFTGTLADGKRVEVDGCDLFTLRGGKIAVKNSFRKNRPPSMERAIPVLPADDLRVAREFYVDRLGFAVRFEASEDGRTGLLGVERGAICLTLDSPMAGHGRQACVSLQVEDADVFYDEWVSRVEVRRPPKNEDWGARTFDVIDPFGNTIFVMGPVV